MPKPTLQELLLHSQEFDAKQSTNVIKVGGARVVLPGTVQTPVTLPDPTAASLMEGENEDPFGGNTNNRRVAERIVAGGRRLWQNRTQIAHFGDPQKALADIKRSKELCPDVVEDFTEEIELAKPQPSPGSPAAQKAAQEAAGKSQEASTPTLGPPATVAPASWKPNA